MTISKKQEHMNVDVSVILINYNTLLETNQCIESIFNYTKGVSFEIIVVDNDSPDRSGDKLSERWGKKITLIQNKENVGFGRANNIGVNHANGNYLFLLNTDTILLNDIITKLYNFYQNHLQYPVIGSILVDKDGNENESYGTYPKVINTLLQNCSIFINNKHKVSVKDNQIREKTDCYLVDYVLGADMFMSKTVFINSQGFDPSFFLFFEESDLQYRLAQGKKNKMAIVKDTKLVHLVNTSMKKRPSAFIKTVNLQSQLIYFKKHTSKLGFLFFKYNLLIIEYLKGLFFHHYSQDEHKSFIDAIKEIK